MSSSLSSSEEPLADQMTSPTKQTWLGLGATPSLVATAADEDKENSNKNSDDGNNTFPMTQDLHLELFDTETQEIISSNPEPGPSGGVKPSLKRLLSEEGNDATTATPEKTRKIDDVTKTTIINADDVTKTTIENADDVTKTTIKHEDDVFELSTDVEDDSKSQSLVGTPIDDNSVLILDDSIVRSFVESQEIVEISTESLPEKPPSPSILRPANRVADVHKSEGSDLTSDGKSGEETDPQSKRSRRSPYEYMADDETSRQLSSSATSGRPGSSLLVDSQEVTISPIHVSDSTKPRQLDRLTNQHRRTSTPGHSRRSPKKDNKDQNKILSPVKCAYVDDSTSSQEDDSKTPTTSTQKEDGDSFKVPGEAPTSEFSLVSVIIKSSEVGKLTKLLNSIEGQPSKMVVVKKGNASDMGDLLAKAKNYFESELPVINKRLSDVSSLSSQSRSSSSTAGYLGDIGSSGSSTLTSGSSTTTSKRDRYSINPELSIDKHRIQSPLPNTKYVSVKVPIAPRKVETTLIAEESKVDESKTTSDQVEPEKSKKVDTNEVVKIAVDVSKTTSEEVKSVVTQPETPHSSTPNRKARVKKLLPRHIRDSRSRSASPMLPPNEVIQSVESNDVKAVNEKFVFNVGTKVFAKWVDKTNVRYWPGVIDSISDDGVKYVVKFDDGFEKTLKIDDLIRVDALEPGQQVSISSEEDKGIFRDAVLLSHPDMSLAPDYMVEFEPVDGVPQVETRLVSYKLFHLSEEQAKNIKRDLGGIYVTLTVGRGDISLDNLVECKRRSRNVTPMKIPARNATPSRSSRKSSLATPRATPVSRKRGGDLAETSVVEEGETSAAESASATKGRRGLSLGRASGHLASTTEDEIGSSAKKVERRRKPSARSEGAASLTEHTVPQIFESMNFILTQSKHQPVQDDQNRMDTETEEDADDSQDQDFCVANKPVVMNKRELKKLIVQHGGTVLEEFPGPKQKIPDSVVLISDNYCRTLNYLTAIVYGFQLVDFRWILDSVRARNQFPRTNYQLAVGYSEETRREMEITDVGNLRHLLDNKHILIASIHKEFASDWKPVLARMGASVSSRSQGCLDKTLSALDLIIADKDAPPNIIKDAKKKNIPVVSAFWIMQSIINGKRLAFENIKK